MPKQHPIVLIHAFPVDSTMWNPLADNLRDAGYVVITPDLPGFGVRPAWPEEKYSMESLADEIDTVIRQQAGGRAIVGGCSVGGYILLALLQRHPESVHAAIFMDTHPAADTPETAVNRMKTIESIKQNGVAILADNMPARLLSLQAPENIRLQVAEMIRQQNAEGGIGLQYAMARRPDRTGLLPTLNIPLLFIVGQDDQITPPTVMRAMAEKCRTDPPPQMAVIPSAGHLAAWEQPQSVGEAVRNFLVKWK